MAGQGTRLTDEARAAFFRDLGRRGGRATQARQGPDYFRQIGRAGGTAPRRPPQLPSPRFYRQVGRREGARVRRLLAFATRA